MYGDPTREGSSIQESKLRFSMPTNIKSFQFSVFIHLVVGALIMFMISEEASKHYPKSVELISINLTSLGAKSKGRRGSNEIPVKSHVGKSLDHSTETISNTPMEERSNSSSINGNGNGSGSESIGNKTSDFNESVQSFSEPLYPKAALRRGLQGALKLKILIGPEGTPLETQVLESSGHKILDDSALEAVNKWVFKKQSEKSYYVVKTIVFQIKS